MAGKAATAVKEKARPLTVELAGAARATVNIDRWGPTGNHETNPEINNEAFAVDRGRIVDSDSAKRRTPRLSAGKERHFAAPVGETVWVLRARSPDTPATPPATRGA